MSNRPAQPAAWTHADAEAALNAVQQPWYTVNQAYLRGDHWQHGTQWIGPMPAAENSAARILVLAEVARQFVADDAIGDVTRHHVDAVAGREIRWSFAPARPLATGKKPTRQEQKLIDEAEAALTAWWDARQMLPRIQQAALDLVANGRMPLHTLIPPELLIVGPDAQPALPEATDLAAALTLIYVEACVLSSATAAETPRLQRPVGIVAADGPDGQARTIEVSFVDDAGNLHVRIDDGSPTPRELVVQAVPHPLVAEATRTPLISEPVRSQQRMLNLALVMLARNSVQAGFTERTFLNAMPPGMEVSDETAPGGKRFIPQPLRTGPGQTNFVRGVEIKDAQGEVTGYANPSLMYRDPTDPTPLLATKQEAKASLLAATGQAYRLISGDATASAVARIQARAEFVTSCRATKAALDVTIRRMLETVLALAATIANRSGAFAGLRAVVDVLIDAGPLTPEERTAVASLYRDGLLARETAMSLLGVEDVDAEIAKINAEAEVKAARAVRIAAAHPALLPTEAPPPATPKESPA